MLTVSEVAKRAGVSKDAIRHYVRTGLLSPGRNPENGYKQFSQQDLQFVRFIRQSKALGFTLPEIREIAGLSEKGCSPCPLVREIMQRHIEQNRRKIKELTELQARMEETFMQWQNMPDGVPNGDSVCCLIESMGAPCDES